jgi:hypothetical protein
MLKQPHRMVPVSHMWFHSLHPPWWM